MYLLLLGAQNVDQCQFEIIGAVVNRRESGMSITGHSSIDCKSLLLD